MQLSKGRFRQLAVVFIGFIFTVSTLDLLLWTHYGLKANAPKSKWIVRRYVEQFETQQQNIEVVLTFPYMLDPTWNSSGYEFLSRSQKEARMDEYMTSLSRILLHPRIKVVHLLHDQAYLPDFVLEKFTTEVDTSKIVFHHINDTRLAISAFKFAFDRLPGRLVMVTQADVYPERGFHLIDYRRFKSERLMYALTRHGRLEKSCDMSGDFCDNGRAFVGSHDSYVFVPQESLSQSAVKLLTTDTMAWGVDLVVTHVFQNELGYRVLNPCKVIFIYHIHCTYIRNSGRRRVNTANTTGWIVPSSDLY